ncbi:MFS transporter [Spongisporangium articulatum]|uniref:MFS transporter n=1 Tax=Spongisporangium articulatum TaxID=3362603 RepID=A0ABW8AGU5_9ACTN
MTDDPVRLSTPAGRWVLLAAVLGSGVVSLDATVVNVALPTVGVELGADLAGLTWVVNGYALTLAALILLGGSLGDRFGRRRVFVVGVTWFGVASLLCGVAPNLTLLTAGRALQGVGGALLTPGSLAMISASFHPDDRARAIGAWSGLGGIAGAIGPLVGGLLLKLDWRLVFLVNLPLCAVVVAIAVRHVPETRDPQAARKLDVGGSLAAAVGLAGVTYALIEAPARGLGGVLPALVVGVLALAAFVEVERRSSHPLVPLDIFTNRQFTAANLVTLALYAALGAVFFMLALTLQVAVGFSPLAAGAALLPITAIMLLLSARAGALAGRIGPRRPMTFGPLIVTCALLLMLRIGPGSGYWTDVLPVIVILGLGLSLTVAPLTATVLAAVEDRHAGVASGVNNAVARTAGLLAVAAIPVLTGLSGEMYRQPGELAHGFHVAMAWAAGLVAVSAVIAWFAISDPAPDAPVAEEAEEPCYNCPVTVPPPSVRQSLGAR